MKCFDKENITHTPKVFIPEILNLYTLYKTIGINRHF